MLTDTQFYLRILEEVLKDNRISAYYLTEFDDLKEYATAKLGLKDDEEDGGESMYAASRQVNLTMEGFLQALGKRAGIDLKFLHNDNGVGAFG